MKKLIIIFILLSLNNLNSNVVYDKNEILVTDLEIERFKNLYKEYYDLELNNSQILKTIILNKSLINKIKANNFDYYKSLNLIIDEKLNNTELSITERYFFQYYFLRYEFIIEYFKNNLKLTDLKEALKLSENLKVSLSTNNCTTITDTVKVNDNEDIINFIYEKFRTKNINNKVNINSEIYSICFTKNNNELIERNLIKIIEKKNREKF